VGRFEHLARKVISVQLVFVAHLLALSAGPELSLAFGAAEKTLYIIYLLRAKERVQRQKSSVTS
jgi:hypothetical protein